MKNRTLVEQISERELVLTRTFDGPAHLVFEAWTTRDLFVRWWVPKAFAPLLVSCDLDVRVGGTYRLVFRHGDDEPMAFHGRYTEVVPASRLVWTNEEGAGGTQITTVTFEEKDGKTLVVVHELYPSKEAFEGGRGAEDGMVEAFDQLDDLLAAAA
ncbi:MAG: SRPBCC family protein [Myxococcales bacterium]|jgi:uncharacterized protein YndB with AHSA1/START domain|nr:SRPBCC family protein [Myxococcales bacterium]